MFNRPDVTVGVPVYQGDLFLQEALAAIQNQTHRNMRVIISLDGPQPASEQLCRPFLKDARFRLVTQPERLGWVGNINWLMAQVETPFWYCHMQDDLVSPRYIEVLAGLARWLPKAAVVYCDIEAFGLLGSRIVQSSVTGSPVQRQLSLLRKHYSAVAFRGLTRVEALRQAGGIPANQAENFSADTVWMAAVARWGELRRVPLRLYQKRYHTRNEHSRWSRWPIEKRTRAWMVHCADMLEQAMCVEASGRERRLLWLATVERLGASGLARRHLPLASWSPAERGRLLETFFAYVETERPIDLPAWLAEDWNHIQHWTREFYLDKTARIK